MWSYGYHFPLATRIGTITYFNKETYSQTTSCHQRLLAREIGYAFGFKQLKKALRDEVLLTTEEMQEIIKI